MVQPTHSRSISVAFVPAADKAVAIRHAAESHVAGRARTGASVESTAVSGATGKPALPAGSLRAYAAGVTESLRPAAVTLSPVPRAAALNPALTVGPAVSGASAAGLSVQDEITLSSDASLSTDATIGADQAPAPDVLRAARLDQIRAAIDAGTYETEDRLSSAVDRLLTAIR